jgi:hypothetical protein
VSLLPAGVPNTADAVIEEMAQAAGVIFAGQVMAVRRPVGFAGSAENGAEGVVEIDLRVDQAVRGPVAGSIYTVREWSGLWNASGGGERYRVGQRLLLFLYAADLHGMSSPVHGRDGAVPLRGGGVAPGPDDSTAEAAQWMVDLRWVQALALRRGELMLPPVRRPVLPRPIRGIVPEENVGQAGGEVRPDLRPPFPVPLRVAAPAQTEPLTQVLALCQQAMRRADAGR